MSTGAFINFLLPFKKDGETISAKEQAKKILQKSQELVRNGSKGVGITYSANYDQTIKIAETYKQGKWFTDTNGANQANVMHQMEALMHTHPYEDLQGKLRIVPITTMDGYSSKPRPKPWSVTHKDIVKADLERIKAYLEDGWDILGWQNQTTIDDPKHPYAVGGGIANLPPEIEKLIQKTLIQFDQDYRV